MDFILTIISEKHSPSLTIKMNSEEATIFAIQLISLFADETRIETGLTVRLRTFQQKTSELVSNLRTFIQSHGNNQELWKLYNILSALADGEYFAVITQTISESDQQMIKEEQ